MSTPEPEEKVRLPLLEDRGSLQHDGSRKQIIPAAVHGIWTTRRHILWVALIGIYLALPWIPIGGHPAVLLDIAHRRFFLFGATFNAQDAWLLFFVLTGIGFSLVYLAAVAGRAWCGFACPQTVFLEGVFRRVERWIEGTPTAHARRDQGPWTAERFARKALKHTAFFAIAFLLAHGVMAYFVSMPGLFAMMSRPPAEHLEAFLWASAVTLLLYGNFAWFREQLCLVICPYGRLQAALGDPDTFVIGYDKGRGEPRGKASDPSAGACVDCKRCVVVCPTGIDIRDGQQLDCIGCTACIDACDEVMDKLHRPRGLVRYDSLNGLTGKPKRVIRPRTILYTVLLLIGMVVASVAVASHTTYEATLLRQSGPPYVLSEGLVRNGYVIQLVNKTPGTVAFTLAPAVESDLVFTIPETRVTVESLESVRVPFFVQIRESAATHGLETRLTVTMTEADGHTDSRIVQARFLGPQM